MRGGSARVIRELLLAKLRKTCRNGLIEPASLGNTQRPFSAVDFLCFGAAWIETDLLV
jgi:hypothetical protein